jgi:hypothetical protein
MTQDEAAQPAQQQDFQEYADARFGFKVQMPKRFEIIPTTVDPLARLIRGLDRLTEEEQKERQQQLPIGFWDPELIGELESGQYQPLRVIEYDVLRSGDEQISEEQTKKMWDEVVEFMPKTLESAAMPGYKYLGTSEVKLGDLPALAFDYRWDGPRPKMYGGDRVRIVWAVGDTAMFHLYYHCSSQEWDKRLPEFEAILATFELMPSGEREQEAARSAAAMTAFSAAKAAGDSQEAAMMAGQAAYEAAMAAEGSAGDQPAAGDPPAAAEGLDAFAEGADAEAAEPFDAAAAVAEAKLALAESEDAGQPAADPEAGDDAPEAADEE